jgi:hypothetical protein
LHQCRAQRRHKAKLKAAAEDSIRLRQENAALQQQITALKQELAQQRASLLMEALRAARNKASIGVVGVGIEEKGATIEAPRPPIPAWVRRRETLWQAIEETLKLPTIDENTRAARERLVTDDRMEGICKKLPEGVAEIIIPLAIWTVGILPLLRSKPQSTKHNRKRYEQYWQRYEQYFFKHWVKHPHPTMGYDWSTCAGWACDLRDVLASLWDLHGPRSNEKWSPHWRHGPVFKETRFQPFLDELDHALDPAMSSMVAAISFLHTLYHCFLWLDAEHRLYIKRLPKVPRPDSPQTPRRFFMDYMSDTMKKLCGPGESQLLKNTVVADLTAVAFDLDGFGPESVRRRRRMRAA